MKIIKTLSICIYFTLNIYGGMLDNSNSEKFISRFDLYNTKELAEYMSNIMIKQVGSFPIKIDEVTILSNITSYNNNIRISKQIDTNHPLMKNQDFSSLGNMHQYFFNSERNYTCSSIYHLYTLSRDITYYYDYRDFNGNNLFEHIIKKDDCEASNFKKLKKTTNKNKLMLETTIYPFIRELTKRENDIFLFMVLNTDYKFFTKKEATLMKKNIRMIIFLLANLSKSDETFKDYIDLESYVIFKEKNKFDLKLKNIADKLEISTKQEYEEYKNKYLEKSIQTLKIYIKIIEEMENKLGTNRNKT